MLSAFWQALAMGKTMPTFSGAMQLKICRSGFGNQKQANCVALVELCRFRRCETCAVGFLMN